MKSAVLALAAMMATTCTASALATATATAAGVVVDPIAAIRAPRPRVIVLTDIGNEPDDAESLVRFLLYANEFDVEGLVATTSVWQRDRVQAPLIDERIDAYEKVIPNLVRHADGYPTAAALRAVVRAGQPRYGMAGVGVSMDTTASKLIVDAVDRADERPVWVLCWGGAVDLAQALWTVRAQRSPEQVRAFVARLRVYSISDQDDAGPWLRRSFPAMFWIASIHGWGQYNMATWTGISGDRRNGESWPDPDVVRDEWLIAHIRRGPLGMLYPLPQFVMEGDTPSFLHLIPTGLGDTEHPEQGGWGGRYMRSDPAAGHFGDVKDVVVRDGTTWSGNQASIYRWRQAFQNDFAARMAWTLSGRRTGANHPPEPVVQHIGGLAPIHLHVAPGETVTLDASGSRDPDGGALDIRWWQYREVGGIGVQPEISIVNPAGLRASFVAPSVTVPTELHIILEIRDKGAPPITRYRRIIVGIVPK